MKKKERVVFILNSLLKVITKPETELQYSSPWELLVAVMLSAQCTDKRVNSITPALIEAFPNPEKMANANFEALFPFIRSISYPNSKTKHLLETAKIISEKHEGKIPKDYDELLQLPGVGRKTANVIHSVLYNEPRMPVDTHVFRVSKRLGLASGKTPEKVEQELVNSIPSEMIPQAHHLLILHGRYTCLARKPLCKNCIVKDICNSKDKIKDAQIS